MKHILLVLSAAVVMAAMMIASALPAFAIGDSGGIKGVGQGSQVGLPPGNSGAAHDCGPAEQALLGGTNHGQCVSFFAQGGSLPPAPGTEWGPGKL